MTEPAQMVDEVPAEVSDTIPDSPVYLNPPTIKSTPSTVIPSATHSGVYSHNAILEHDATELWRYLLSNLKPPQLVVRVKGKIGLQGGNPNSYEEFSLSIDVSNEVNLQWSRILTTDGTSTISRTLEKYTSSRSYPFKEFRLKKVVVWDKDRVTRLIKDVVKEATSGRFRGESVSVKFRMSDDEVVALGSNWISRAAYNKSVRCLCYASCLCGVFGRKKQRLECEYRMAVSADDLVSRNSGLISSGSRNSVTHTVPIGR